MAAAAAVNVRVAVRVRPFNKREKALNAASVVDLDDDGKRVTLRDPNATERDDRTKTFVFDHAYGADSTQPAVYADLGRPLIDTALKGYNGTIFAYGQTGRCALVARRPRYARRAPPPLPSPARPPAHQREDVDDDGGAVQPGHHPVDEPRAV